MVLSWHKRVESAPFWVVTWFLEGHCDGTCRPVSICMEILVPSQEPVLVCLEGLVPLGPHQQETGEEATATCCGRAGGQQRGLTLLVGRNVGHPTELFAATLSCSQ